ncbi:MAG: hypothetical protein H6R13_3104 [Proteobacteria bacterium]|nr:hypothetical protein [Pseudomonadota bacterium]
MSFETKPNREDDLSWCIGWQRLQRADGTQRCLVENGVTTPLLDTGCADLAGFVYEQQDVDIALQAAGNGFRRVKLAGRIELREVLANSLCPGSGAFG